MSVDGLAFLLVWLDLDTWSTFEDAVTKAQLRIATIGAHLYSK